MRGIRTAIAARGLAMLRWPAVAQRLPPDGRRGGFLPAWIEDVVPLEWMQYQGEPMLRTFVRSLSLVAILAGTAAAAPAATTGKTHSTKVAKKKTKAKAKKAARKSHKRTKAKAKAAKPAAAEARPMP